MQVRRKVIAINEETGERREFSGTYEASKLLGCTNTAIRNSILDGHAVMGWRMYDTPDRIRERIKELKKQIKMLEG